MLHLSIYVSAVAILLPAADVAGFGMRDCARSTGVLGLIGRPQRRMPAPEDLYARTIRRALVIAADTVVSEHAILAAKTAGVEVYDVSGVGRVHRLA